MHLGALQGHTREGEGMGEDMVAGTMHTVTGPLVRIVPWSLAGA